MKHLIALCVIAFIPLHLYAQEPIPSVWNAAAGLGILLPATLSASYHSDYPADETYNVTGSPSPLFFALLDYKVTPKISLGCRVNAAQFAIKKKVDLGYYEFDDQNHTIPKGNVFVSEYMVSVKYAVKASDTVILQPALYIGYIYVSTSNPDLKNEGLGINMSLEGKVQIYNNYYLFGEFGLATQPYGGINDIAYVKTKYPVIYFAIGAGL